MSHYEKYKDVIKTTNQARRAAIARLIDAHRADFDDLYLEEARARGLNPTKIEGMRKKAEALAAIADEEAAFAALLGEPAKLHLS